MKRLNLLRVSLLSLSLAGCAIADEYTARAIHYNVDAARTKDEVLLLNVMRAAYRKPLQFSDITSVTGTAQISGGVGTVLPLLGQAFALGRLYQVNPTASAQGGPSFVVNIQNTKEFYQGILQPLSLQAVALLEAQGIPKSLLYTLLLSKVDVRETESRRSIHTFYNEVFDKETFTSFADFINDLIDANMTVETTDPRPIGAPVSVKDAGAPDLVAKLRAQNLTLSPRNKVTPPAGFDIVSMNDRYHFCFKSPVALHRGNANDAETWFNETANALMEVSKSNICGLDAAPQQQRGSVAVGTPAVTVKGKPPSVELDVTFRSVEGIIYYLGEIAREELGQAIALDTHERVSPFKPFVRIRVNGTPYNQTIFNIGPADAIEGKKLSVEYEGKRYGVPVSSSGEDRSTQVMELVLASLALNNSAKDQPAPSIITVLSR